MSGGKLEYVFDKVETAAYDIRKLSTRPLHLKFAAFLDKVAVALKDVEWVISGDCDESGADQSILAVMPPRPVGEHLTAHERRRLKALAKRRDWLRARITEGERTGKNFDYDKEEASAITWAIEQIEGIPVLRKQLGSGVENGNEDAQLADLGKVAWCGECRRGDHSKHGPPEGVCSAQIPMGLSGHMGVVAQCACPLLTLVGGPKT